MNLANPIVIVAYSTDWPQQFEALKQIYLAQLGELIVGVEHVGSTSVPGLAAKPILDIDLIIADESRLSDVVGKLAPLGYQFAGDWGIPQRYAFIRQSSSTPKTSTGKTWPVHHLYVCIKGCASLRNHLHLRDRLRQDPQLVAEYAALKYKLAEEFSGNIDAYIEGKTAVIINVLKRSGFAPQELAAIVEQNKSS